MRLEEYRPIESVAESAAEESVKSAASQSCALGGGEVSTGADGDIDDAPFEEAETGSDKA